VPVVVLGLFDVAKVPGIARVFRATPRARFEVRHGEKICIFPGGERPD
jgi:hypothetical protein